MPVNFRNLIKVLKIIHIDIINEVRRLCSGEALSRALFFLKSEVFENKIIVFQKFFFYDDGLSSLRVGRSVTRLTVH